MSDDQTGQTEPQTEQHAAPRTIDLHHDGHGLNESIGIYTDEPDGSGAAHLYNLVIDSQSVGFVQFQKGPRHVEGSTPGATEASLYAILIDRLTGFQAGPYACHENARQLSMLEECLHATKARADERAERGVLGQNVK